MSGPLSLKTRPDADDFLRWLRSVAPETVRVWEETYWREHHRSTPSKFGAREHPREEMDGDDRSP